MLVVTENNIVVVVDLVHGLVTVSISFFLIICFWNMAVVAVVVAAVVVVTVSVVGVVVGCCFYC